MEKGEMGVLPEKHPLDAGPVVVWAVSIPTALRDALKGRALQRGMNASKYAAALLKAAIALEDAELRGSKKTR